MRALLRFWGGVAMCATIAAGGCTTTTRPANAANREIGERNSRTDAANRETDSRYSAPRSGPGSLEGR